VEFYAEHIEADAVHEQLLRRGVVRPLVAREALTRRGRRVRGTREQPARRPAAEHLLACWERAGVVLRPVPAPAA
jgi:hypothetical protein